MIETHNNTKSLVPMQTDSGDVRTRSDSRNLDLQLVSHLDQILLAGDFSAKEFAYRARDVIIASILIIVLLPLLAIIVALIALDSKGPVLFIQKRGGRFGKVFRCWKFRTMTVLEDGSAVSHATKDDHRVTRVGRFLRRTSLDELPQLVNVIKGEMSLVGPRPHAISHDVHYSRHIPNYMRRYSVSPGITGLAQISGARGECKTTDHMKLRVDHDLHYIKTKSFIGDLKIMLLTPIKLLSCKMAY